MPDSSAAPMAGSTAAGATQSHDFLPRARSTREAEAPSPPSWVALSKAECVLWAIALHRAAVAARLSGGEDR
jgi:hypothetical protein